MTEIRLDLIVEGNKRTFTQDFVPYRKSLEYTEQETKILKDLRLEDGANDEDGATKLRIFRAEFVASLFSDSGLTVDILLDGLDAEKEKEIMDIIQYRVLNFDRPKKDDVTDPKEEV